eukprot:s3071_g5.t1
MATLQQRRAHAAFAGACAHFRMTILKRGLRSLFIDVGSGRQWPTAQRRLAAKDRAAEKASSADHRRASADVTAAVWQREPREPEIGRAVQVTSIAMCEFGVKASARSATRKAAAAVAAVRGDTRVVSTANCTPPRKGRPLAMTSMRRSSCRGGGQH